MKHDVPNDESDALFGVISVRIWYWPGPGKTSTVCERGLSKGCARRALLPKPPLRKILVNLIQNQLLQKIRFLSSLFGTVN